MAWVSARFVMLIASLLTCDAPNASTQIVNARVNDQTERHHARPTIERNHRH